MEAQCPEPDGTTYVFGPFRLVPSRQLLLRNGIQVRIGGRALDILTLLARRPGEVVTKNELLQFVWPDTFVQEANLKVNMAALRRTLAEGSSDPYIATVAGRGYRFVARVEIEQQTAFVQASPAPPARSLPKRPAIVGRSNEIAQIVATLTVARSITVVGPGGVGKTAIALAVAHHMSDAYAHGVAFIDLSTVGDAQYAMAAIAAGVGVRQRSEDTLSEVIDLLHGRHMLLILDNCEHLAAAVATVVNRLLEAIPTITLLATSREPLRTTSEQVHRLPTLALPTEAARLTAEEALDFGAVQLFVTRVQEKGPYVLTDDDAPLVCAICRRLDGIALAIELAASKALALGVPQLSSMLEQRFLLVRNGERSAPLRQQTLLATLDWSYRLLSEDEAALLRLLSVFAGAFRLQDAVAMSRAAGFDATQTIDALERLTNKSIVCADYRDGKLSYRLLKSTRAYASERLADAGEQERALQLCAWHVLELFERAAEEWEWREKSDWMVDYADRVDDLRNAMAWALGPGGDRMMGIRLTAAAIPLWNELSSMGEMQSRVERALLAAREMGNCPSDLTAKLIAARASGMSFAMHLALDAESAWHECYKLGIEIQSPKYQLYGLWGLASYLVFMGRNQEGINWFNQFMSLAETQGDWPALAEGNRSLAMAEIYTGKIASARQRLERLVTRHQRSTDPVHFARFHAERGVAIRCSFAIVLWISGEPDRAMDMAREAVDRAEATGHVVSQSNALAVCAIPIALWTGDLQSAARFLTSLEQNGLKEDIGIWREVCRFFRSVLRAKRQEPGAAAEMRVRLEELMAARFLLRAPMHFSMVAEALLASGAREEARELIEEAHSMACIQCAEWCMPEILRISGLIELRSGNAGEAERLLRLAIGKAREIGALTLELRAAFALSAKLETDGHVADAYELLDRTCARFKDDTQFTELTDARRRLHAFLTLD
ncbi:ATP-binding protein [Ancylobacter oerskovii]|uniref:ATP-binding protein n=1 Tax=Ancylobacter oerskovii TaxID=459519 RepID=A0ABW4YZR1_9HYPH|nr:winged helix-turn-helix domain-containing protein [Ancylobacter oerskovii]MBS7543810.1 winged helix-turn-helix domain-containing protein [Ancylobacter oerskovii]